MTRNEVLPLVTMSLVLVHLGMMLGAILTQ